MNAFYGHHQGSIRFGYRCFDRILLNGVIQQGRLMTRNESTILVTDRITV